MSFAYKKIHPENVTISPYYANKQYNFDISNISGSGITLYFGEYTINDIINYFDPVNDNQTSNNEYKRLIFNSVKHLFYKNYIDSGSLITSSSYYDYPQTTLYSGTFDTNLRRISKESGSSFQGVNSIYNDSNVYDNTSLYDETFFDAYRGSLVTIISIDKNLYGNNILPNTFLLESGSYYVKDDGEGNVFDYTTEENYNEIIESGIPTAIYIGNIFYSLGLVVVTNQDYICLLGSPPTAINNYYTELNVSRSINYDITENDYSDCGGIDFSSVVLIPIEGYDFPDSFIGVDGFLYLVDNQTSYVPGSYKIGYTVNNNTGLQSNLGYIYLNIIQQKLEINNLNVGKICNNTTGSVSYSFDIDYGVPVYSYSFDNINYTSIPGFNNITVTGSTSTSSSILYVRDYINNIVSTSFNAFGEPIIYNFNVKSLPSCDISGGIFTVTSSNASYFKIDSNPTQYPITSSVKVSNGSHYVYLYNNEGCVVTSSFSSSNLPPYSYSTSTINSTCLSSGTLKVNNFQGTYSNNISIRIIKPDLTTSSYNTSSLSLNNLTSGSYSIQTYDGYCHQTSSIIIGGFSEMILSSSVDYSNPCFTNIIINVSGGIAPYIYQIQTPGGLYNSDTNNIQLYYDNLNPLIATASVTDNNGCKKTIYQEVYGRQYIYSGSYCEQS